MAAKTFRTRSARLLLASLAVSVAAGGLAATAARADDYDDALRCLVLIGQAKENYTADNVDALREAGRLLEARADESRPPDLTDQQKIDRLSAAIDEVVSDGGIENEGLRGEAVFCANVVGVDLKLPGYE